METLRLDGNAAAGLLHELFGVEMTTAVGMCDSCGTPGEVGSIILYRGAGLTFRCPVCDSVLIKIVATDDRAWVDMRGVRTLEVRH
jgi:Family of unknown function (DUF6510)